MGVKVKVTKKQVVTVVGITILLVSAVIVGVVTQLLVQQNTGGQDEELVGPTLPTNIEDIQNLRSEGNDDEANNKIEEELASTTERSAEADQSRYMLYIQKGHIAFDAKQWQQAIEAYGQAEAINETRETAELLAEAYKGTGDKAKAIEYYKKAISLIPQDNPLRDSTIDTFEYEIRQLGGRP